MIPKRPERTTVQQRYAVELLVVSSTKIECDAGCWRQIDEASSVRMLELNETK